MAKDKAKNETSEEVKGGASEAAPQPNESSAQVDGSLYDGTEIKRKLTPKTIMGKIKRPEEGANPSSLYVIMGQCDGVATGSGDYGDWVGFTGQFEAVRSHDGSRLIGSVAYVPKAFEALLYAAVKNAQQEDKTAKVEFAVEIGIQPSTAAIGYEYWVKNLVKTIERADPLAALRAKVMTAVPKLAAPKAPAA